MITGDLRPQLLGLGDLGHQQMVLMRRSRFANRQMDEPQLFVDASCPVVRPGCQLVALWGPLWGHFQ